MSAYSVIVCPFVRRLCSSLARTYILVKSSIPSPLSSSLFDRSHLSRPILWPSLPVTVPPNVRVSPLSDYSTNRESADQSNSSAVAARPSSSQPFHSRRPSGELSISRCLISKRPSRTRSRTERGTLSSPASQRSTVSASTPTSPASSLALSPSLRRCCLISAPSTTAPQVEVHSMHKRCPNRLLLENN